MVLIFLSIIIIAGSVVINKKYHKSDLENSDEFVSKPINILKISDNLTVQETNWLKENHIVKIRVANSAPYQMNQNGKFEGVSVDYIEKIFKKYNIKYKFVSSEETGTWKQALEYIRDKKEIDLLLAVKNTPERQKDMLFTDNYLSSPWVIFTRNNSDFISGMKELEGKQVAVEDGFVMQKLLQTRYPQINLKTIKGITPTIDALQSLAVGNVDAFVGNLTSGSYISKSLSLDNIKVAAPTPFGNHEHAMAIRDDWSPLVLIINRELKLINNKEKSDIYNKYLSIRYEHGINFWDILMWVAIVAFIFSFIVITISITNKRLNKEIKQRKKSEEQILIEREQFLSLLNAIPEPIYVSDIETDEVLFANDSKEKLSGADSQNKKCYKAFHNFDSPCDFCHKNELIKSDTNIIRWEQDYSKPKKYFQVIDKLITWHNGRQAKFQISFDLTELKKAEQEIRKLSIAVEQSPATIVITDTTGKIEYVNPKFTELTGYTAKEAIGQNPKVLKSGKTDTKLFTELWASITSGKTWNGELINKKKNKEEFIERAIIAPIIDNKGQITNYIAVKEDITTKKAAEIALKKSEIQLRESNATKDKFFSIIAHDLKSPFNAILGFSNILLKKHAVYDDQKREKLIKSVNDSANNAFKLLENLLTWARTQSGGIEYKPEKLHLKILLFETMFDLQAQANKKGINIIDKIQDDETIFADKNMLATVLRNLISNAIKFTTKNDQIVISSNKQSDSNFLEISVKDSGVGIPKEKINDLFRIEKNTSTQGTENETGTGLGLILCKEFVEKHGGKIWIVSEDGKGSDFKFTLPLNSD